MNVAFSFSADSYQGAASALQPCRKGFASKKLIGKGTSFTRAAKPLKEDSAL
jgi:hypothetical protein